MLWYELCLIGANLVVVFTLNNNQEKTDIAKPIHENLKTNAETPKSDLHASSTKHELMRTAEGLSNQSPYNHPTLVFTDVNPMFIQQLLSSQQGTQVKRDQSQDNQYDDQEEEQNMIEESADDFNAYDINSDEEKEIESEYLDQVKHFHQASKHQSARRNNPFLWKQIAALQNTIDKNAQSMNSANQVVVFFDPNEKNSDRFDDVWRSHKIKKDIIDGSRKGPKELTMSKPRYWDSAIGQFLGKSRIFSNMRPTSNVRYQKEDSIRPSKVIYQQEHSMRPSKVMYQQEDSMRPSKVMYQQEDLIRPTEFNYQHEDSMRPSKVMYQQEDSMRPSKVMYQQEDSMRPSKVMYQQEDLMRPIEFNYPHEDSMRPSEVKYQEVDMIRPSEVKYQEVDMMRPLEVSYQPENSQSEDKYNPMRPIESKYQEEKDSMRPSETKEKDSMRPRDANERLKTIEVEHFGQELANFENGPESEDERLTPRLRRAPLRLSLSNNLDVLRQRLISSMERKKTNQNFGFVQATTPRNFVPSALAQTQKLNRQYARYKPVPVRTHSTLKYRPAWRSNKIRDNIWSNFLQATSSFPRHIREIGK